MRSVWPRPRLFLCACLPIRADAFRSLGRGDVNTYALFAELFSQLTGPHGRAGVIVPTGIATDATTAPFFGSLIVQRRLVALVDFENRDRIFPAIDMRLKFSLLTIGKDVAEARFSFFLTDPAQRAEPERRFALSPSQIAAINPNTKTAPIFRSRADADLTTRIYTRVPVLIEDAKDRNGNPWGVSFARLFDMAVDSGLFRTAAQLRTGGYERDGVDWIMHGLAARQGALTLAGGRDNSTLDLRGGSTSSAERYVPLYEAKMIHQFDHRWATYEADGKTSRDATLNEKADPRFEPAPRYWVPEAEVAERLATCNWTRGWLMGWRDITNATNERTMISAAIPRVACGDKYLLMFPAGGAQEAAALLGFLSSITADFVVRQKLGGTSFKYYLMKQIPFPPFSTLQPADLAFIIPRVVELSYTSHALASFARDLGYEGPPFAWNENRRALLRAELDAFYARAYGLRRDELRYILDPADVRGPDYPSETFRVLKTNEITRYGEYRTARLVLDAWDRTERGELT